jgi:hypothetical protein
MSGEQRRHTWVALGLIVVALPLAACQQLRAGADVPQAKVKAATVEKIQGSEISRLILTARAAERLDIKTATVVEELKGRPGTTPALRKVVPYGAVLYDSRGLTWVYTNPDPMVYVRHRIAIDYIEGGAAVLTDGPSAGVKVVTVGASLLLGTEFEVGEP